MGAHTVHFYEDDTFLIKGLSDYIGAALDGGNRAIAFATGGHLLRLAGSLRARGPLDAEVVLPLFMEDGQLDEARFRDTIGNFILDVTEVREGDLFICGEMGAM